MTIETVTNTLSELESQAETHLQTFRKGYWQFIGVIQKIRELGEWQAKHLTWEQYLSSRWLPLLDLKSTSRIRQLESAYSVMQLIRDVTDVTLNESQIRKLRHVVPQDDLHLMPEIVSIVFEYTSTPSERHYLAAYEVIKERNLRGSVNLDGESVGLNVTKLSAIESMIEADKRQKEHIATNSKWELVNRYEYTSAYDARQAFNELSTLQALETGMVIVVQIKRMKSENVTVVTSDESE